MRLVGALLAGSSIIALAQSVPSAIYTDPAPDKAHPAKMTVLHIPSHGMLINGIVYQPSGAGAHPTVLICHGLPGNEKNLDLAQALRRAGWNAVTFNYRGSWGSPGNFRFPQNLEDAAAVLAYLRDTANSQTLGVDTGRIAIIGHSMGGWVVAHTASNDHALIGAVLISAADVGRLGGVPRPALIKVMADNLDSLAGVTPESMADELMANAKSFSMANDVEGLKQMPLLVLTADDGLAPQADAFVSAIGAAGGHKATSLHFATDHGWSDRRITLESEIIKWLAGLRPRNLEQVPHLFAFGL
jgi:pimeloyl-ACP methyl ester carboxylesterase